MTDARPIRICLVGTSLESGNFGVQALAASLVRVIHRRVRNPVITFMYGGQGSTGQKTVAVEGAGVTVNLVRFRQSPAAPPRDQLGWAMVVALLYACIPLRSVRALVARGSTVTRTFHDASVVGDIRGGDSFSDIYGVRRFLVGNLPTIIALLMRKDVVLLPQTYGPFTSRAATRIAASILRRARHVIARDAASQALANELMGPASPGRVGLSPDVAFLLEPIAPATVASTPPWPVASRPRIGINISGLLWNGGYGGNNMFSLACDYQDFARRLLLGFLQNTGHDLVLISHMVLFREPNVESDYHAARDLREQVPADLRSRVFLIEGHYDQHELKSIIGQCEFFVGSRMHACIAALSQGIPGAGAAYSRKFDGVFRTIGSDDMVIDLRTRSSDEAINQLWSLFDRRHALAGTLAENLARVQERIEQTLDGTLFERVDSPVDPKADTPRKMPSSNSYQATPVKS